MKILFIDKTHPALKQRLEQMGFSCHFFNGTAIEELYKVLKEGFDGIIVRSKFKIDKSIIDKSADLRFIARVGAGMEGIDEAYAASRNIVCFNAPEGNRTAVGEHTTAMILNLLHKISVADNQVKKGIRLREANRGVELCGKTIGIIGYGNMGGAFAKCISGFGAHVIAYDKYKKEYTDDYVRESSMAELFEKSDIVSLHVPLTQETFYMADKSFFNRFKKNIILVNTARGQVVCTQDLVNALKSGKVIATALDVIEYESASFEKLEKSTHDVFDFLCRSDKVLMTPHVAGWTVESHEKMALVIAEKIQEWLKNNN